MQVYALTTSQSLHETLDLFLDEPDWKKMTIDHIMVHHGGSVGNAEQRYDLGAESRTADRS